MKQLLSRQLQMERDRGSWCSQHARDLDQAAARLSASRGLKDNETIYHFSELVRISSVQILDIINPRKL